MIRAVSTNVRNHQNVQECPVNDKFGPHRVPTVPMGANLKVHIETVLIPFSELDRFINKT